MSIALAGKEAVLDIDCLKSKNKSQTVKGVFWVSFLLSFSKACFKQVRSSTYAVISSALLTMLSACGSASPESRQSSHERTGPDIVSPTANAGQDIVITEAGSVVHLSGRYSHDDSDLIASYFWQASADNSVDVFIDGANSEDAAFFAPSVSKDTQLTFFLEVIDSAGNRDRDRVVVTIEADPVLSPIPIASKAERKITALLGTPKNWQAAWGRN